MIPTAISQAQPGESASGVGSQTSGGVLDGQENGAASRSSAGSSLPASAGKTSATAVQTSEAISARPVQGTARTLSSGASGESMWKRGIAQGKVARWAPTLAASPSTRRAGSQRPCQRRASAGASSRSPAVADTVSWNAGRERQIRLIEQQQDHGPAQGVGGGGRALGQERQHGQPAHHRRAHEGGSGPTSSR